MRPLTIAVLLSPLLFSAPLAHAAQPGTCGTPEAIGAQLKAEGQHNIAFGKGRFNGDSTDQPRIGELMFTADRDGGTAYILEVNQPPGVKADKACIVDRLDGVKLFDPKSAEFPKTAMMQGSDTAAAASCEAFKSQHAPSDKGTCAFFGTLIQRVAAGGERVLMQGRAVSQRPIVITVTINLLGKPAGNGEGNVLYSDAGDASGASLLVRVFKEAQQTDAGQTLARK
jgi:hypothetical protein